MNRRAFLKNFGAVSAIPAIATTAGAAELIKEKNDTNEIKIVNLYELDENGGISNVEIDIPNSKINIQRIIHNNKDFCQEDKDELDGPVGPCGPVG